MNDIQKEQKVFLDNVHRKIALFRANDDFHEDPRYIFLGEKEFLMALSVNHGRSYDYEENKHFIFGVEVVEVCRESFLELSWWGAKC